jgi:hypothetical protein
MLREPREAVAKRLNPIIIGKKDNIIMMKSDNDGLYGDCAKIF